MRRRRGLGHRIPGTLALAFLFGTASPRGTSAAAPPQDTRPPIRIAAEAHTLEEMGAFGQAADLLRSIEGRVPKDGDLQLAIALNEARSGQLEAAAARLWGPVLGPSFAESTAFEGRAAYGYRPAALLVNGGFDGWRWYLARARAEVAASLGRWKDARDAARLAVRARPLAGKEWLILGVAAGRAGDAAESAAALDSALYYDPSLPEAHYLSGLVAWRSGRRAEAQSRFRRAVELDSSYRAPAFALVRSRLPSAAPDTLPGTYLEGVRAAGLLTSNVGPKLEIFVQNDVTPELIEAAEWPTPDSLRGTFKEARMALQILVDERGRIVLHDLPWFDRSLLPAPLVGHMAGTLPRWRYEPARKSGEPRAAWTTVHLTFVP